MAYDLLGVILKSVNWIYVFAAVSGEGIVVVCVSRVPAGAARGAEKDSQLSQQQQQPVTQACTVSMQPQIISNKALLNYYYQ